MLKDSETGKHYDSKAIVGAAYGFQFPEKGPLRGAQFSGGENTVERKLEQLGFEVVRDGVLPKVEQSDSIVDYSWTISSPNSATKIFDKSAFNQGSGIPVGVRSFFMDSELQPREHRPVILEFDGKEYGSYLTKESSPSGRTRMFWSGEFIGLLAEQFPEYAQKCRSGGDIKDDPKIAMTLERVDGFKRYRVSFDSNLPNEEPVAPPPPEKDWTDIEFEAAVKAYIWMLAEETAGRKYNKAEVNRNLRDGVLSTRTKSSVEFRMQNISAALQDLGLPTIKGYLPAKNVGPRGIEQIQKILAKQGAFSPSDYIPTNDPVELEKKVRKLRKRNLVGTTPPQGVVNPKQGTASATTYARDPRVKAWVLDNAEGICEGCGCPAPFMDADGKPFLEVHHVIQLCEGGPDTTKNAVALCPNCHRRCHMSGDKKDFSDGLYGKVGRLVGA
jgi:5-methylcytosine-specific restriction protein A